ncbi:hypothetical protein AB835_11165 [Candidatus Endobugula sertula]|uniref:ABC transporter n=1 Tax=Candidatus Endobugula sertula TaxID=62101 RepID=A0A1D2QN78_9GAMM|nr:hypothetical protein AB835_11165 [Candidatus Endobugula sertula]
MYSFNNTLDTYFLKPVSQGYRYVTPDFVETGISNLFSNLGEMSNIFNAALQGKGERVAHYTGRFLFNSTIGLGGLFDVADAIGIEKINGEDFGQTLGTWGVESGPYLVLPFLGPSTIRDGFSIPVNTYTDPVTYIDHVPTRNRVLFVKTVDTRAKLLKVEELISGDRYLFMRDAYLQRREFLINDGEVQDTFGEEEPQGDF